MAVYYIPGPEGGMVPVDKLPDNSLLRIREAYEAGHSVTWIQARLGGGSAPTILRRLREMGVEIRPRGGHGAAAQERTLRRSREINEIYLREGSLEAAGKVLGITRERVRQILCRGGFLDRIDRILDVKPPTEWWQMRVDFEAGESLGAIAHRYGVNIETCRARIRRVGGDTRKQSRLLPFIPRMRIDYESGLGFGQIGAKYGFSAMAVHRHLLAAGVKSRPVGTYERRRA